MTMGIPLPAQKFSLGGLYHILSGAVKRKYFFVDKPAFPVVPAAHQHFRPMAKKKLFYSCHKIENPNLIPIRKRFGFYWFGMSGNLEPINLQLKMRRNQSPA